ncbi:MAG: NYN domain-containing protein, partial [Candidatus Binatia bacterium]
LLPIFYHFDNYFHYPYLKFMAVHLVIDAYNLIGSETGLTGDLEGKRTQLIQKLRQYHERKSYPITVVFDGWRSGWINEVEERSGGITVIFSQQGEKADSVIARLAREMGSGCIVVTSDREVRRAVEASGAVAIYAGEFSARLKNLDRDISVEDDEEFRGGRDREKKGNPRRLSKSERKRRERLKKL